MCMCLTACDQQLENGEAWEQQEASEELQASPSFVSEALVDKAFDEEETRLIEEFELALEDADLEELESEDGTDKLPGTIDDITAVADPAANCLATATWKDDSNVYALMYNNCGHAIRVRVIWAKATDSQCYHINPHTQAISARGHKWRPDPYVSAYRAC